MAAVTHRAAIWTHCGGVSRWAQRWGTLRSTAPGTRTMATMRGSENRAHTSADHLWFRVGVRVCLLRSPSENSADDQSMPPACQRRNAQHSQEWPKSVLHARSGSHTTHPFVVVVVVVSIVPSD